MVIVNILSKNKIIELVNKEVNKRVKSIEKDLEILKIKLVDLDVIIKNDRKRV